jgi:hypothetical protein
MGRLHVVKGLRRTLRQRLRGRRYTPVTVRVGLACALGAAVCIVELGSGSGADTSFVPGDALARSQAISLAPTTGGLNYAITLATSVSNYQDMQAQSLSQTIDLGAIGTSLEAQGCDGSAPTLPQSDVPPPVQAESTSGNQSLSNSITPQSSSDGLGIGNEAATATTQPSSGSLTTVSNIAMPGGLLAVNGLTSSAKASIDNGATRTATATADIGQLSLGTGATAVVLGGLQWTATQQSGGTTTSAGTFSVGSLTVAGVPVDLSSLSSSANPQTVLNVINTALSPIGLNVQWPTQTTLSDGTVQISPLVVGIDNNALGQQVVGTNENSVQPVREALVNALLSANCNFATELTVGDIGMGVLSGGGNLNLELGGASAETDALAATSPFGAGGTSLPSSSLNAGSGTTGNSGAALGASTLPVTSNSGVGPLGSVPTSTGAAPAPAAAGAAGGQQESLGPMTRTSDCISLGPSGGACDSGNAAVPIGLGALALVVALFTWDALRQRRRLQLHGAAHSGVEVPQ